MHLAQWGWRRRPGPCLTTVIWRCGKPFGQWQHSFHRKPHCHWLKFLRQRHVAVVRQGPVHQKTLEAAVLMQQYLWINYVHPGHHQLNIAHMASQNLIYIGSGNSLVPKPVLTFHQWSLVALTWLQFLKNGSRCLFLLWVWKLLI